MSGERILVLDADSNAGLAILQSLGAAGYTCIVGAKDDRAPAFSSRWVRGTAIYPDPLRDAEAFKKWIAAWVRANDVALVIPATECTLVPLHEMRDDAEVARRVAMPSAHALDSALDKEKLRALAAELGVPVPASAYITSPRDLTDGRIDEWLREGAAVVKTTKSKAWKGTKAHEFPTIIVSDRDELKRSVLERVQFVPVQVQQWVPGRGLGVELLARDGEIVMSVAHERLHEVPLTGGGSSYRRTIPMPAPLLRDAEKLMRALEYTGVAMVEFRGDGADGRSSRHWLMEINVRFWGSLPLAIFAGADFPRALVDMLLHDKLPDAPPPRTDVYARKLERDVYWMKLILKRRGQFTPYELTQPLGRSLLEWGRVLTGREAWDGANLQDPRPFLREVSNIVGNEVGAVVTKARKAADQQLARRLSPERAKRFPHVRNVLILCYGNICRSAYAAARMKWQNGTGHEIRSAGFHPKSERTTPEDFMRVAKAHGIDLSSHRSQRVSLDDLDWAEMIVLMDQRNYDLLRDLEPKSLKKVVWLGALDGGPVEIEDPYGEDEAQMEAVLGRLDACLDRLARGVS
jgi:protein-tyrosine-phosphatase/predicted ATP-grasp superfamily ATP-dependent carboligase